MTTDHRTSAEQKIQSFIARIQQEPPTQTRDAIVAEAGSLAVAIHAFHMEGIRFRMFNVDRLLVKGGGTFPQEALQAFAEARGHLEAAGFHTRSHQAPT